MGMGFVFSYASLVMGYWGEKLYEEREKTLVKSIRNISLKSGNGSQ